MKKQHFIPIIFLAVMAVGFFYRRSQAKEQISLEQKRKMEIIQLHDERLKKIYTENRKPQYPELKSNPYNKYTEETDYIRWKSDSMAYFEGNKFPANQTNPYEKGTIEFKQWKKDSIAYIKGHRN